MKFSEEQFLNLQKRVKDTLSEKRFLHTLGVIKAAEQIAGYCCPDSINEIRVAALLHDITKELSFEEQLKLLELGQISLDDEDKESPAILHSYTAPVVIERDYPEFANKTVLSAVRNHTLGSPDMTVADEIIFVSDFVEESRTYEASLRLREFLNSNLKPGKISENEKVLHSAVVFAIDSTVRNLLSNKKAVNTKNILTRNALLSKI